MIFPMFQVSYLSSIMFADDMSLFQEQENLHALFDMANRKLLYDK